MNGMNRFALIMRSSFIGVFAIVLVLVEYRRCQNFNVSLLLPNTSISMVSNGTVVSNFTAQSSTFNCSSSSLYTYIQNPAELKVDQTYTISFTGTAFPIDFNVASIYGSFTPNITPTTCLGPCNATIQYNCQQNINFFNYYDQVVLTINGSASNEPLILTYNVLCNSEYVQNTFQWGLLIEIVVCTIIIAVVAIFSKAWSLGGNGITFNIWLILLFNILLVIGGLIGTLSTTAIQIILDILTFVLGIFAVAICVDQILFLTRVKLLKFSLINIGLINLRVMDLIGLAIGAGLTIGWWFSSKNWILNDLICGCMIVAYIKILKFTSLKMALAAFVVTMVVEMAFVIIIHYTTTTTYNLAFLNDFNYPFELQLPTINAVVSQKCAWLPINAIIYPGMLLSYLRRFDSSRNTNVYLITSTGLFLAGSISWMFISIANPFAFPLGLLSEPAMIGLVCIFAYKRREIRTLWEGKFYDEEFADKEDLKYITELVGTEKRQSELTIGRSVYQELKIKSDRAESKFSVSSYFQQPPQENGI